MASLTISQKSRRSGQHPAAAYFYLTAITSHSETTSDNFYMPDCT